MRFLRRIIRKTRWRLEWMASWWPTGYEMWEPVWRTWKRFRHAFNHWYAGRDFRRLWFSLPAILAVVFWLVFAGLLLARTRERIGTQYTGAASQALASRRYEEAALAFERLLQTDRRSDPSHIFGLASSLQGLGQGEEAAALLASIAPLNASGYAPAHLWLARSMLGSPSPNPSAIPKAEAHLKWVLLAEPRNTDARLLLGALYAETRQWALAREHLQKAYPARKEAALMLARVAAAQGDEPGARKWAQDGQSAYKADVAANPGAVLARARWAEATLMLGQFADALAILRAGITQSGDKVYSELASRVCGEWANKIARESPADLATRLSLIQRGLEYAPNNRELLAQLITLSHLSGKEADAARETLKSLLVAGGKDTALLHFCLGGDAWQRGRLDEARQHFTLAFELAPQMPYVANNMALMLAASDPPDLPRALAIIEPLAQKFPADPHILETRGQILVKMGKWQDGVKYLELALPSLADRTATHKALGEAYQNLGLKELADEHQRLAAAK